LIIFTLEIQQMGIVNIKGADKVEILRCLINNACMSLRFFKPLEYKECQDIYIENETKYFDTYNGKSLHINLNGDNLYTSQYNEKNGKDSAYKSIKHLLTT
jgi:hypothetical protein